MLFCLCTACGIATLFYSVNQKIKRQIELDQTTGQAAIQLRAALITLEDSEQRLTISKKAMQASCAALLPSCPSLVRLYEAHKKIEEKIQMLAKKTWALQEPILKQPLSSLKDILQARSYSISLQKNSLVSTSKVWKTKGAQSNGWKIAWTQ